MRRISKSSRPGNGAPTAEFVDERQRLQRARFWLCFAGYLLTFLAGLILGALAHANS